MLRRLAASFFFSNWFLGVLAIALSIETNLQLGLPLNSTPWYLLLFATVVLYYTYAYQSALHGIPQRNPRTDWFKNHAAFVKVNQVLLLVVSLLATLSFLILHHQEIKTLSLTNILIPLLAILAALSYYNKIRFLNLRFTGWTKPLTIGFCWAVAVSYLPLLILRMESADVRGSTLLATWLLLKNWMFCTANAILFDIKDFEDDTNKALKTFVVTYGINFTLFRILLPIIACGILSFSFFAIYRNLNPWQITLNLFPFLITFGLALSLQQKKRSILYYLVVIDGMLLVKALCGILASTILA